VWHRPTLESKPTGTQIRYQNNGWSLPTKCVKCRELFSHKPFSTVKEVDLIGGTVFRTYNSLGQLISESRDKRSLLGQQQREHRSRTGKLTGITERRTDLLGFEYRQTTAPDGHTKSISQERTDLLGQEYTESTGGTSQKKHQTHTKRDWTGKKYRETR